MSAIKEARPTEYKGVLYRSKSEAMFARYLELQIEDDVFMSSHEGPHFSGGFNCGQGGFIYEPSHFDVDGWKPDFLLWQYKGSCNEWTPVPYICYHLIEYKPSRPTETYAKEFAKRCRALVVSLDEKGLNDFGWRVDCRIYYGSIFNTKRGEVWIDGVSPAFCSDLTVEWKDDLDWLSNFEEQVKATRFDLVAAAGNEVLA